MLFRDTRHVGDQPDAVGSLEDIDRGSHRRLVPWRRLPGCTALFGLLRDILLGCHWYSPCRLALAHFDLSGPCGLAPADADGQDAVHVLRLDALRIGVI